MALAPDFDLWYDLLGLCIRHDCSGAALLETPRQADILLLLDSDPTETIGGVRESSHDSSPGRELGSRRRHRYCVGGQLSTGHNGTSAEEGGFDTCR